jgi:1-acyl-sn-glycerol-3-phosphate acyltransferase
MLRLAWYMCGRAVVEAYSRTMLQMDIECHTTLPAGPKIIAPNHPTTNDPILITLLTAEPMHVLITEMCFKMPVVGHSLRVCRHVPVVAGHGREAFDEARRLLDRGETVTIFPEGDLSPDEGGFRAPRSGAARLALLTGAPVIPVGISLERGRILRRKTTVDDDSAVARWYAHGPYAITAGEPIRFTGDAQDRKLVGWVSQRILQRIASLSMESAHRIVARRGSPRAARSAGWLVGRALPADGRPGL